MVLIVTGQVIPRGDKGSECSVAVVLMSSLARKSKRRSRRSECSLLSRCGTHFFVGRVSADVSAASAVVFIFRSCNSTGNKVSECSVAVVLMSTLAPVQKSESEI